MGRRKLENRKINKSGRFEPELLDQIVEASNQVNLSFSQTLEFLAEIGVYAVSKSLYTEINKRVVKNSSSYAEEVKSILQKGIGK